jgi:hypothetical protein
MPRDVPAASDRGLFFQALFVALGSKGSEAIGVRRWFSGGDRAKEAKKRSNKEPKDRRTEGPKE